MICRGCGIQKLSREFPDEPLSDRCKHTVDRCYRCMVKHLRESDKCPVCTVIVRREELVKEYDAKLVTLFPWQKPTSSPVVGRSSRTLTVMGFGGDNVTIRYSPDRFISDIKTEIQKKLSITIPHQRLFCNKEYLKERTSVGRQATLEDYNVKPGSTIDVAKSFYQLASIGSVVFEVQYRNPCKRYGHNHQDFIDISAMLYQEKQHVKNYDHSCKARQESRFTDHAGGVIYFEPDRQTGVMSEDYGRQSITIQMSALPDNITSVFFVLSAWQKNSLLSEFTSPEVNLSYTKTGNIAEQCEKIYTKLPKKNALIVCRLDKLSTNQWELLETQVASSGNIRDYPQLKQTIQDKL